MFQCSSASRKFLNVRVSGCTSGLCRVSVLFSEPKIPQCCRHRHPPSAYKRFSALQRAENSSIEPAGLHVEPVRPVSVLFSEPKIPQSFPDFVAGLCSFLFQCSSASRKFLNQFEESGDVGDAVFQCSSASRKFLNDVWNGWMDALLHRFSALQRAENSSIKLFAVRPDYLDSFSALQRAENSSIPIPMQDRRLTLAFQCSSASRKFLNVDPRYNRTLDRSVSVLFSEPKIPQSVCGRCRCLVHACFSALQRAENSSMVRPGKTRPARRLVSVLFSEPKIPQSF